jgi:hypothetical protein
MPREKWQLLLLPESSRNAGSLNRAMYPEPRPGHRAGKILAERKRIFSAGFFYISTVPQNSVTFFPAHSPEEAGPVS